MAELNHNTIKDAIVTLLKSNASLFTTTGEADELRKITTGKPTDILQDDMFPYAIVTDGSPLDTTKSIKLVVSQSAKLVEHVLRYKIIVVVNKPDSRKAENLLDNLEELIRETMEGDMDIGGTVDTHTIQTSSDREVFFEKTSGKRARVFEVVCEKVIATSGTFLGELTEFINSEDFYLQVGSAQYLGLEDLVLHVDRHEFRRAPIDVGPMYRYGFGDNWFSGILKATGPEIETFNTNSQIDSEGDMTSTAFLIKAVQLDDTTKTFACTGVLRTYELRKADGKVMMDIFVRITGDTVTIT